MNSKAAATDTSPSSAISFSGRYRPRRVRTRMPDGAPGTLSNAEYADSIAYLLQQAGFPAGAAELPPVSRQLTVIILTFETEPRRDDAGRAAGSAAPAAGHSRARCGGARQSTGRQYARVRPAS
jgi:hypothetical protein